MTQRICSVVDCDRPAKTRGWCNTHYERWRIHGTTDDPPTSDPTCKVAGCDRPTKARGWCKYHWQRWSRGGDPVVGSETRRSPSNDPCAVEGCDRPPHGHGWCNAHHYRWAQYGDPEIGSDPAPQVPRPDDWVPAYSAAHWRVHRANGPAPSRACIDCGAQAAEWSYDHSDPAELTDEGSGMAYSLDVERYDPRCVSCHRKFDNQT